MKFDPTISLGTILTGVAICFTIVSSMVAAYLGVTRHMTKNEEQIAAMLQRIERIEKLQTEHSRTMTTLGEALAGMREQLRFLYDWATGKGVS